MKKLLSILLAVLMIISIVPLSVSAETVTGICGTNLTWTFDTETGVLTIDGEGEMDNYELYANINRTTAPWWDYYSQIKELVIGENVTSIGNYAFYKCSTLTNVDIPNKIKVIGDYAFSYCSGFASFNFKGNNISIGRYAFSHCDSITNLSFQGNNISIEESAFTGCDGITILSFLGENIAIGYGAFFECTGITNINFNDSICSIGSYAFTRCTSIEELIIPDSVTELSERTFSSCDIKSLKIGNGLTEIPTGCFEDCDQLQHIEWGTNLKTIGALAFKNCSSYSNIIIPDGVETIEYRAFYWSGKNAHIPLSVKTIGNEAFSSSVVYYEGSIDQWENIKIGSDNTKLRNATFYFGHAHSYTAEITSTPTCLETGIKTFTCDCGDTYTRELSALGHDVITDEAVSATCTETGLTEGEHCSRCDYKLAQEETPSLGHNEKIIPAVAATCSETGLTEGIGCSRCDEIFIAQEVVPTIEHKITNHPAVPPTCTETGLTAGEGCSECSYRVNQEIVPALGHAEVIDKAIAPTCTETGLTEGKHCDICGVATVPQEIVHALGHKEIFTSYVEPTCTETGLSVGKVCEACGEVFILAQIIPAKGHNFSNWIVTSKATCETDGIKIKICSCGLTEEEIISATGHTDADNDGKCDNCSYNENNNQNDSNDENKTDCKCVCHEKGFFSIFYKILSYVQRFFKVDLLGKVLKIGQICSCGEYHY